MLYQCRCEIGGRPQDWKALDKLALQVRCHCKKTHDANFRMLRHLVERGWKRIFGAQHKSGVVAHGMGTGGQMAYYVGFNARDVFRGVAVVGSTLGTANSAVLAVRDLLRRPMPATSRAPVAGSVCSATSAISRS